MPKLTYSCVLTHNIARLGAFYREVLQLEPRSRDDVYLEFQTQPGIFSLWAVSDFDKVTGGTAHPAPAAGSVMLEFEVPDVDAEFKRLQGHPRLALEFILEPTTLPWGNRSIYFRDPDGNLINFFSRVSR